MPILPFPLALGFPGGSEVKASASNAGDRVRSLGREDPLEKEMVTHSSILAWRIPWMEKLGRATVHGVAKSQTRLSNFTFTDSKTMFIPTLHRWENI